MTRDIKVLYIDLTTGKMSRKLRPDLAEYLGGAGIATKLLQEEVLPQEDALDPRQPIILATGPLAMIYPSVTKTVAMFKSPLTGELGESHAGMRLAMAMRLAGVDAIVITGKSKGPSYLSISDQFIGIKNAEPLWGYSVEEAGRSLRELEPGSGHRSCVRIGPAGERLVSFACVNVDTFRHFGRLGMGAVFGSKMLKAIVITGAHDELVGDRPKYNVMYQELYEKCVRTAAMEKYHELGTPVNIKPLNAMGGLPTLNLQSGTFDKADEISGEAFAEERLIRKIACPGCPVGCIHVALSRRFFGEGYEVESATVSYDYELIFALGSFIGVSDKDAVLQLIEDVELYGLDAISSGIVLGWVTEAFEKGLISEADLGTTVAFGAVDGYRTVLRNLVKQPNQFYRDLARGLAYATKIYGGADFAAVLGGNEMPGYHTGYGSVVGLTVATRHSHLDNAGYSYDQSHAGPVDIEKLTDYLIEEEQIRCALNSLVICLFARKVYDLETTARALDAAGIPMTVEDLQALGRKIFALKLQIRSSMGFDLKQMTIPNRFFETPTLNGKLDRATTDRIMARYLEKIEQLVASEN